MIYDYLIVGSGFFGSTFARLATDHGKKCLIIEARNHLGGNAYSEKIEGIHVHKYGPHVFHTNSDRIWAFVNRFSQFTNFILSPKAYYKERLYSLPFNMNTFYEMWGTIYPDDAQRIIDSQRLNLNEEAKNLEEQALSLVGRDIYEKLIRGYTKKQWNKDPSELPAFIIKRLPVRFTYNNNYFDDKFQGVPTDGYDSLFKNLLTGIEVIYNVNYHDDRKFYDNLATKTIYTGKIDEFYNYQFGRLEYRSLKFEHEVLNVSNYQGNAVINFTDDNVPYTRIIEHKHFNQDKSDKTIITREFPLDWTENETPYYPINNNWNMKIYNKYRDLSENESRYIFGGRLAEYRYYDMHQVIGSAMKAFEKEIASSSH